MLVFSCKSVFHRKPGSRSGRGVLNSPENLNSDPVPDSVNPDPRHCTYSKAPSKTTGKDTVIICRFPYTGLSISQAGPNSVLVAIFLFFNFF